MNQIILIILAVLAILPLYGIVKLLRTIHTEQEWHNNKLRLIMTEQLQLQYKVRRDGKNAEAKAEWILDKQSKS